MLPDLSVIDYMQVFIMGFGDIGFHLAKCLRPFGVKVLATKRSWGSTLQSNGGTYDDLVDEKGGLEDFHQFAKTADIVVFCLVSIVSKSFISSMKKYHHPRHEGRSASLAAISISGYSLCPICCLFILGCVVRYARVKKGVRITLKIGQCKFGMTCKFHHPQPAGVHSHHNGVPQIQILSSVPWVFLYIRKGREV